MDVKSKSVRCPYFFHTFFILSKSYDRWNLKLCKDSRPFRILKVSFLHWGIQFKQIPYFSFRWVAFLYFGDCVMCSGQCLSSCMYICTLAAFLLESIHLVELRLEYKENTKDARVSRDTGILAIRLMLYVLHSENRCSWCLNVNVHYFLCVSFSLH